jgi:hypothetical protein
MRQWSFITNHARVLLLLADDPDARLRDLAAALDITERTTYGIVTDLVEAGYLIKQRGGRRNRYHIQEHLPLPDPIGRERTIGEVLELLAARHVPSAEGPRISRVEFVPAAERTMTVGCDQAAETDPG